MSQRGLRSVQRLVAAAAAAAVLAASPAYAEDCTYPPAPSTGQATVDKTRVEVGDCVKFDGAGFTKNSTVQVSDNGTPVGTEKATGTGTFRSRVCFDSASDVGEHLLEGRGVTEVERACDPGTERSAARTAASRQELVQAERVVTATVTVTGVRQEAPRGGVDSGELGGPLPRTGSFTALETLLGAVLLAVGLGALLAGRPSRRRTAAATQ